MLINIDRLWYQIHKCEPERIPNQKWYYKNISVTTNSESYRSIDLYIMANFGGIYS